MLYINQLDYRHIPYHHNVDHGGVPEERRNVATSGCGLCSACMVVQHLTGETLSVEDCVRLSEENGANRGLGTDMRFLGPVVARMYGLEYEETSDTETMLRHLEAGGEAIEILLGDRDGVEGLFSHLRHYITLVSVEGNQVRLLDPSNKPGKYETEFRKGRVREEPPFLFASPADLEAEGDHNVPLYYLFRKSR